MNREEITRLAQEAGFVGMDGEHGGLRRFAALVASAEREACAKVCDSYYEAWINIHGRYEFMGEGAQECAEAIRARGQA